MLSAADGAPDDAPGTWLGWMPGWSGTAAPRDASACMVSGMAGIWPVPGGANAIGFAGEIGQQMPGGNRQCGDGIGAGSRFRLEDCADDVAALAGVPGTGRFAAVGYSMGGMVAQLLYRRHAALVSRLVLCSTASNARGSLAEQLAALAASAMAAALRWNPMLHLMGAESFGVALIGCVDDPATGSWAWAQLSRTTLATAVSAVRAVCEFTSDNWICQVDVPTAVVVTPRDRIVPPGSQLELVRAVSGASVHEVDAGHGACITAPQLFAPALLQACWSVEPDRHARAAGPH